jgi:hypothetical protein
MGVKLNTASGGSVSIDAANTASNFTLTVPAQTGAVVASDSSGNVGIGTSSPTNKLEVSSSNTAYWNNSTAWTSTPLALTITNTRTGGYDPVLLGRMTDQGGTSKNSFAIGTVGTASWTAGDDASQTADMYFAVRNNSGGITERARITSGGDFRFNSGYGSVATAYGCRAWVALNASSGSPSIEGSGNISSITDNGAGDFTLNFATSMPDANYSPVGMSASNTGTTSGGLVLCVRTTSATGAPTTKTTSALRVLFAGTGNGVDAATINVAIFR